MKSKIHTINFHSTAPEVLQEIDAIGMAQVASYIVICQNELMTNMMRSGDLPLPSALKKVVQENIAVLNEAFQMWSESLSKLAELRNDIIRSNKIDANAQLGSPANVAEQILEELAQDTEFDTQI